MTKRSDSQGWVLGAFVGFGGLDALHPESRGLDVELGYDQGDLELLESRVKSGSQITKAWVEVAAQVRARAEFYEHAGFRTTAASLYVRAALLWAKASYTFFSADRRKLTYREIADQCTDRVGALGTTSVQRVEIPFEGHSIFAILHRPADNPAPLPIVVLVPGMDMVKEAFTLPAHRRFLPAGMAAIAIEGPGQGATRLNGLAVDLTNYERAISAVIDYLVARSDIDQERIGLYGMSMGSYWGLRAAAHDKRLRAVATALGCYGDMEIIFNRAHPNFKRNYMFMSDYDDEEAFDRDLGSKMSVWDLADQIQCPVFMGYGEFDELTPFEDTLRFYNMLKGPKELCVFEHEFHPLGGVAAELMQFSSEWLARAMTGAFDGGRDEQRFMRRWGPVQDGDATPPWWLGAVRPAVIDPTRREP